MNKKTNLQEAEVVEEKGLAVQGEAERLIAQAIDKNVDVATMERLLAMRKELKAEWAKEQFDKAMADFQRDCPVISKNSVAGSGGYTYRYADLTHIVSSVRELLAKNGFSYTFDSRKTDKSLVTICHVKHIDGHSETSEFDMTIDASARMNVSQKDGAANSYGKRYAFVNAFGILTGDEDTDAVTTSSGLDEGSKSNLRPVTSPVSQRVVATPEPNKEKIERVQELMKEKGKTTIDLRRVLDSMNLGSLYDANEKQLIAMITNLEAVEENGVDPDEAEQGINQMKGRAQ